MIVLDDEFFSLQREKTSLVFLLWTKAKKFIHDGPSNIARVY